MQRPSPDVAREYSSFVMKYVAKNRRSLHVRFNGLVSIAAMISSGFGDDTKQSIVETSPSYSETWARLEFPVLVDIGNHQIFYYQKPRGRQEWLCERARTLCDKWFGF